MYLNFKVEVPACEGGISRKTIKGTTYIYYEHGRKYYKDRGYTVPQCTSIGKLCEDEPGMMIPNGNYLKFFPDAELLEELPVSVRSGCLKIGVYLVIKKVMEHYKLDEEIKRIIGKEAGLFLDLATYVIVRKTMRCSIIRIMRMTTRFSRRR